PPSPHPTAQTMETRHNRLPGAEEAGRIGGRRPIHRGEHPTMVAQLRHAALSRPSKLYIRPAWSPKIGRVTSIRRTARCVTRMPRRVGGARQGRTCRPYPGGCAGYGWFALTAGTVWLDAKCRNPTLQPARACARSSLNVGLSA